MYASPTVSSGLKVWKDITVEEQKHFRIPKVWTLLQSNRIMRISIAFPIFQNSINDTQINTILTKINPFVFRFN